MPSTLILSTGTFSPAFETMTSGRFDAGRYGSVRRRLHSVFSDSMAYLRGLLEEIIGRTSRTDTESAAIEAMEESRTYLDLAPHCSHQITDAQPALAAEHLKWREVFR